MLTILMGIVGLVLGLISDGNTAVIGAFAGIAVGQAFAAASALSELRSAQNQLRAEQERHAETLRRVEGGMLWMWHDWQRVNGQRAAAEATPLQGATARATRPSEHSAAPAVPGYAAPAGSYAAAASHAAPQAALPHAATSPTAPAVPQTANDQGPIPQTPAGHTPAQALPNPAHYAGTTAAGGPIPHVSPRHEAKPPFDLVQVVREFFFGGNTIARAGILVLLVGVVLLLKWAADNDLFPIEARMGCAAAVGVTLIALGYRLRSKRPAYSGLLQGGGIAALYLTVFFSFHTYQLLPGAMAFALLAAIAVSSCAFAAVQNSLPLFVIGCLGGFMAPILASTGSGNHVMLFSYYLLLNVTILGISVYKQWRSVALLGFVFTFGVGSAWGGLHYEPEKLASTEPFLLAFGAIFSAIPWLMHWRNRQTPGLPASPPILTSSLLFGTPITVLVLQGLLLKDEPMQMAFALVGLAAAYLGSTALLLRQDPSYRPFAEAYLAVGIGFATLAIPFAVSNQSLTGGAWALEGAGMVWVGVRQQRARPRWFGVLLQLAAGLSLGYAFANYAYENYDSANNPATHCLLGAGLLAISCYFVTYTHSKHRALVPASWRPVQWLLPWGLVFGLFFAAGTVSEQLPEHYSPGIYFALLGIVGLTLELVSAALEYEVGRWPALALFVITPLAVAVQLGVSQPLENGWQFAWPALYVSMFVSTARLAPKLPAPLQNCVAVLLWSATVLLGTIAQYLCRNAELSEAWGDATFTLIQAIALVALVAGRDAKAWPMQPFRKVLVGPTSIGVLLLCLGALLVQTSTPGDALPLPYIPLLNPLDLSHVFALQACVLYLLRAYPSVRGASGRLWVLSTALVAFVVFNGVLARGVHHALDVPYVFAYLWQEPTMHWVLSGAWTVVAVSLIFFSSRQRWRTVWLAAASLMALTVFKLFVVDLSRQSTVAKILTFMAVGIALLVVGFASPLPPRAATPESPNPGPQPFPEPQPEPNPAPRAEGGTP
jgi:uncharacterized membrane protein